MSQLKEYFKASAKKNILLTGKLFKILNLLKEHDILAIPYKGPILAELAYNDILLRQFNDLDILINKKDILKTKEILSSHGFRPLPKLTQIQELVLLEYMLEHSYIHNADGILIDIHWRIAPKYFTLSIDYEKLWERLKPVSILNRDVLTFSPEDLLFILCIHGIREFWNQMYLICDIAKLINSHKEMNWDFILNQANRLGNKRFLLLGLFLANDLFGAKLPEKVLLEVKKDSVVLSVASNVYKRLFDEKVYIPNILEKSYYQIKLKENTLNKLKFLYQLIIMVLTTDCKFLHLPKSLNFLCLLFQPIRLFLQYRLRLMKKYKID